MKSLILLALLATGDRIEEIKWLTAKEAFAKALQPATSRWVLVYKEWPR